MRSVTLSGLAGIVVAVIAGGTELLLTGGNSTFVPLISGLIGAFAGWIVLVAFFSDQVQTYSPYTFDQITSSIRDLTNIERKIRLRLYRGQRLRVVGEIRDVSKLPLFVLGHSVFIQIEPYKYIHAVFSMRWSARVRALRVGEIVEIDGKIQDADSRSISLSWSRLIGVAKPTLDANGENI